jgi:hypothetical protein
VVRIKRRDSNLARQIADAANSNTGAGALSDAGTRRSRYQSAAGTPTRCRSACSLPFAGATSPRQARPKCSVTTIASWPCSVSSLIECTASSGCWPRRYPLGPRATVWSRHPATGTALGAPPPPPPPSRTRPRRPPEKKTSRFASPWDLLRASQTRGEVTDKHQRKANAHDGASEARTALCASHS